MPVKWGDSQGQEREPIDPGYRFAEITEVDVENGWKEMEFKDQAKRRVTGFENGVPVFLQSYKSVLVRAESDKNERLVFALEDPRTYMCAPSTYAILETLAPGKFRVEAGDVEGWPASLEKEIVGKRLFGYWNEKGWLKQNVAVVPPGQYNAVVCRIGYLNDKGQAYVGLEYSDMWKNVSRSFPSHYRILDGEYKSAVVFFPWNSYPVTAQVDAQGVKELSWGSDKGTAKAKWLSFCQVELRVNLAALGASGALDWVLVDDNPRPDILKEVWAAANPGPLTVTVNPKGFVDKDTLMPSLDAPAPKLSPRQQMFAAINVIGQAIWQQDIMDVEGGDKKNASLLSQVASAIIRPVCAKYGDRGFVAGQFIHGGRWDEPGVGGLMAKVLSDGRAVATVKDGTDPSWAFEIVDEATKDEGI